MAKHIVVIPGDGIGKEITDAAVKVLQKIDDVYHIGLTFETKDAGGTAYDKYGVPLTADTIEAAKKADAADGMANQTFDIIMFNHRRFFMKTHFKLMIIDTGIAGKNNQNRLVIYEERHRFGNTLAFCMKCGCRFFDRSAGLTEFLHPVFHPPLGKIFSYFLNRHICFPPHALRTHSVLLYALLGDGSNNFYES